MSLNLQIDKTMGTSVYLQVADQIRRLIHTGALKPGDRLPTERELADQLNLARGTVNKAYEILERESVIQVIRGSGSYVFDASDVSKNQRMEQAVDCIQDTLKKLDNLHFSVGEIHALIDLVAARQTALQHRILVAAIDCSPESLSIFSELFSRHETVEIKLFLLEEILKFAEPETIFSGFDLILTTTAHYEQVINWIPALRDIIFKVVVSPTQSDIIAVAKISPDARVGMIVRSEKFAAIMAEFLESMSSNASGVTRVFEDDIFEVNKLILEKDVLIIPHMLLLNSQKLVGQLRYFYKRGGMVIDFQHQIEQGSIIHVEECIERILSGHEPVRNGQKSTNTIGRGDFS